MGVPWLTIHTVGYIASILRRFDRVARALASDAFCLVGVHELFKFLFYQRVMTRSHVKGTLTAGRDTSAKITGTKDEYIYGRVHGCCVATGVERTYVNPSIDPGVKVELEEIFSGVEVGLAKPSIKANVIVQDRVTFSMTSSCPAISSCVYGPLNSVPVNIPQPLTSPNDYVEAAFKYILGD